MFLCVTVFRLWGWTNSVGAPLSADVDIPRTDLASCAVHAPDPTQGYISLEVDPHPARVTVANVNDAFAPVVAHRGAQDNENALNMMSHPLSAILHRVATNSLQHLYLFRAVTRFCFDAPAAWRAPFPPSPARALPRLDSLACRRFPRAGPVSFLARPRPARGYAGCHLAA